MSLIKVGRVSLVPKQVEETQQTKARVFELLGDWFLKNTDKVLTASDIAQQLLSIRVKLKLPTPDGITREYMHSVLTKSRQYLETPARRSSIVFIPELNGYRCGNQDDLAMFTARWIKRTLHSADRTTRLTEIVDKDRMPGALKKVFVEMHPRIKSMAKNGGKFIETFKEFVDQKRLEAKRSK